MSQFLNMIKKCCCSKWKKSVSATTEKSPGMLLPRLSFNCKTGFVFIFPKPPSGLDWCLFQANLALRPYVWPPLDTVLSQSYQKDYYINTTLSMWAGDANSKSIRNSYQTWWYLSSTLATLICYNLFVQPNIMHVYIYLPGSAIFSNPPKWTLQ